MIPSLLLSLSLSAPPYIPLFLIFCLFVSLYKRPSHPFDFMYLSVIHQSFGPETVTRTAQTSGDGTWQYLVKIFSAGTSFKGAEVAMYSGASKYSCMCACGCCVYVHVWRVLIGRVK